MKNIDLQNQIIENEGPARDHDHDRAKAAYLAAYYAARDAASA